MRTVVRVLMGCAILAICLMAAGTASAYRWEIQRVALPPGFKEGFLNAVSCISSYHCLAVGSAEDKKSNDFPLAVRWNGSSWRTRRVPLPAGDKHGVLNGVSCSSGSCVAVGEAGGSPFAERWNGSAWSIERIRVTARRSGMSLDGVSCWSHTFCIAVGQKVNKAGCTEELVERWDGRLWSLQRTPRHGRCESSDVETDHWLSGVSCTSSTSCVAAGTTEQSGGGGVGEPVGHTVSGFSDESPLLERWNGTRWSVQKSPYFEGGGGVDSVSCTSRTFCTVAGGDLARWDGRRWLSHSGAADDSFAGVSCTSGTACTAVGTNYSLEYSPPILALWDGREWSSTQRLPRPSRETDAYPAAVSCASRSVCAAVGAFDTRSDGSKPMLEFTMRSAAPPAGLG